MMRWILIVTIACSLFGGCVPVRNYVATSGVLTADPDIPCIESRLLELAEKQTLRRFWANEELREPLPRWSFWRAGIRWWLVNVRSDTGVWQTSLEAELPNYNESPYQYLHATRELRILCDELAQVCGLDVVFAEPSFDCSGKPCSEEIVAAEIQRSRGTNR